VVVAVDEHREQPGDRAGALASGTGALQQARQVAEHARGKAARDGGFAGRQRHVAGGMGVARDRIDDHQHLLAAIAEILGDGHGGIGGEAAHHRALVPGRNHHHRLGAGLAQRLFEELADFPPALAHQRDHHRVETFRAGEHREHGGFADARAGEDADALPGTERREQIDHAHARADMRADAGAMHGRRRFGEGEDAPLTQGKGAAIVNGLAQRIKDAPAPARMRMQRDRLHAMHLGTEPGIDRALERLDRGPARINAHHLADLGPGIPICGKDDALPQFEEGGEPPDAVESRRHRADPPPDTHKRQILRGAGHGVAQPVEGIGRRFRAISPLPPWRGAGGEGRRRRIVAVDFRRLLHPGFAQF